MNSHTIRSFTDELTKISQNNGYKNIGGESYVHPTERSFGVRPEVRLVRSWDGQSESRSTGPALVGDDGLPKEAGLAGAILRKGKALLTGRRTLFHGTSPTRAKEIKATGLRPQAKPGVSDMPGINANISKANKGLVFTTKKPEMAKMYAAQQRTLDSMSRPGSRTDRFRKFIKPHMGPNGDTVATQVTRQLGTAANMLRPSTRKGVVRMSVPARAYRKRTVKNPEIDIMKAHFDKLDLPKPLGGYMKSQVTKPFKRDQVMKGGVSRKAIKDSPGYKPPRTKELMNYWRWAGRNPGTAIKDAWQS